MLIPVYQWNVLEELVRELLNQIKKPITVRFFGVRAEPEIVRKFKGSFLSLIRLGKGTDVVINAQSRYILRCLNAKGKPDDGREILFWSSVKERHTWQVRSTQDGRVSGLEDANSIVGDISYYKFDIDRKIIAAFTTYSSSTYLKSMCTAIFRRLTAESAEFTIDYLSDDVGISQIREWDYYSKISIKIDTDKVSETDDPPELIKALLNIKDTFGGNELSVTLDCGRDRFLRQDVAETINYLSSSESCRALSLAGGRHGDEEKYLPINLKKAFIKYRTSVELKLNQAYIDSQQADSILNEAISNTHINTLNI